MADKTPENCKPVVIKKYANRRLYNTTLSHYVTLEHLCQMVKDGIDFIVLDAKANDITRSVLTQIIVEEEAKGGKLLPLSFLRQLITFYGDNMQRMLLSCYLEYSINTFVKNREEIQNSVEVTFGKMFPFDDFEQWGKNNFEIIERAIRMLAPFEAAKHEPRSFPRSEAGGLSTDMQSLQHQLEALQAQLNKMTVNS